MIDDLKRLDPIRKARLIIAAHRLRRRSLESWNVEGWRISRLLNDADTTELADDAEQQYRLHEN
ncbi:hypothetical protein [Rhodopseudomonas sp. RCAM05734]|uniref:hypothetical protein n=1 Tax=Rhodopseudomonas sp. RCAM05734 TaxID=3457549 RepID=UPI00404500C7